MINDKKNTNNISVIGHSSHEKQVKYICRGSEFSVLDIFDSLVENTWNDVESEWSELLTGIKRKKR